MVANYLNLFIFVFGLLLMAFGGGNFSNADYNLDERSFTAESLKMIEQNTGLAFPVGSRGLHMFYQNSLDPAFVAKVEIPADSKDILIKQIEQIQNKDGSVAESLTEKVTWWKPSEATIRIERQFTRDASHIHVLFCQEQERWVIYLTWFSI